MIRGDEEINYRDECMGALLHTDCDEGDRHLEALRGKRGEATTHRAELPLRKGWGYVPCAVRQCKPLGTSKTWMSTHAAPTN